MSKTKYVTQDVLEKYTTKSVAKMESTSELIANAIVKNSTSKNLRVIQSGTGSITASQSSNGIYGNGGVCTTVTNEVAQNADFFVFPQNCPTNDSVLNYTWSTSSAGPNNTQYTIGLYTGKQNFVFKFRWYLVESV